MVRSGIRPSVWPGIRSGIRPYIRPTIRPSIRSVVRPYIRPTIRSDIRPTIWSGIRPGIWSRIRPDPIVVPPGPIVIPPRPKVILLDLGLRLIGIDLRLQIGGTEDQGGSQSENSHAKHLKLLHQSSCLGKPPRPVSKTIRSRKGHNRPARVALAVATQWVLRQRSYGLPVGQRAISLAAQETSVRRDERQVVDHGGGRDKAVGRIRVLEAQAATLLCHGMC